jgi:hypothetical protein
VLVRGQMNVVCTAALYASMYFAMLLGAGIGNPFCSNSSM